MYRTRSGAMIMACAMLMLALFVAGCGSKKSSTASAASIAATREKAMLSFTRCVRSKGVQIADPTTGADGNLSFPRPANIQDPKTRPAMQACRSKLQGVFGRLSSADRQKLQDYQLKLAQCMRKQGVNMPDPSSNAQGGGPPTGFNRQDPNFRKAFMTCRSSVGARPGGRGGFGGGPGGGGGPASPPPGA